MNKRICVFCGSRPGRQPIYADTAAALGQLLAKRGIDLVYGGAAVGTMGVIADATLAAGGTVIGVIPETLVARELAHPGLTELHVVASMHARKERMAALSQGFITLPGGAGTLDELFEMFTWLQLGLQRKPCALINVDGYYDQMLRFLDHAVAEGFIQTSDRAALIVGQDPPTVLDALLASL